MVSGNYYLCDVGYTNDEGFLAPYRAQRYHLSDWRQGHQCTSPKEFFNMKHSSDRNIIERAFGLLKGRWAILRSRSFYPIKTQCWIISTCALLHNYIRREMTLDPQENSPLSDNSGAQELDGEHIRYVETSDAWSDWRDNLVEEMYEQWSASRH